LPGPPPVIPGPPRAAPDRRGLEGRGTASGKRFWGSLADYDRRIVRIVRAAIQRDPTHANR
jgi:hypothetical protein